MSLDGYRMPAEWSPHSHCLILYPQKRSTFRVEHAQREVRHLARVISEVGHEEVVLFCPSASEAETLKKQLQEEPCSQDFPIHVCICPSDDQWARDTGPTIVTNQEMQPFLVGLNWEFNGYGGPEEGCVWPCTLDQRVALTMMEQLRSILSPDKSDALNGNIRDIPLILEGGSIHTDGQGTILTTEECLLNKNRNPSKSRDEIETIVLKALGAKKMIWLPTGVADDDDTNGHVDNMACFVRPGHVLLSWTDDEQDKDNYDRCRAAKMIMEKEHDAEGRSITVHKLYLPPPIHYTKEEVEDLDLLSWGGSMIPPRTVGERMAASYVNFYIANEAVLVPQFGFADSDRKACETIQEHFPERKVVGVPSKDVLIGGGNIHCITQQVPRI